MQNAEIEKKVKSLSYEIVDLIGRPVDLIRFISNVMAGIQKFLEAEDRQKSFSFLQVIIDNIAVPWMEVEGGREQQSEVVCAQINCMLSMDEPESYFKKLSEIIQAFNHEVGNVPEEELENANYCIHCMFMLGILIMKYEQVWKYEKRHKVAA